MMRHALQVCAALGVMLLSSTIFASPDVLSEEEVLRRARTSYPMIRAARLDVDAASGDVQAAEGAFDVGLRARGAVVPLGGYPQGRLDVLAEVPTELWGTTLIGGYRWGSDTVAPYDGKVVTNDLGEIRAGVAVPIWRNGPIDRRRASIERSELAVSAAERGSEQAALDASRAAGMRYWAWVGAALRRSQVQSLALRAQRRVDDIAERVTRGDLPAIDRDDAERSFVQRRQQLVAAERLLQQTAIELSLFLRRADGTPDVPSAERAPRALPALRQLPPETASATARTLAIRPDLARLELQRQQQEVEIRWATNQLAPAFDLSTLASQDLGDGSPKREPFELEIALTVDIPIDTDVAQGRRRAAQAAAARAVVTKGLLADQTLADLRDARAAATAAAEREALSRRERELADRLAQAERDRLDLGESTVFLLDLREQAALEAAIRQIDAGIEARRAVVAYRAAAADLN